MSKDKYGTIVAIGRFVAIEDGKARFQPNEGEDMGVLAKGDRVIFVAEIDGKVVEVQPSLDFTGDVGLVLVQSDQTIQ
jgi:hypothetical protein